MNKDIRQELYSLIDKAIINQRAVDDRKITPQQRTGMDMRYIDKFLESLEPQPKEVMGDWRERFWEKFPNIQLIPKIIYYNNLNHKEVLTFIEETIHQAKREERDRIIEIIFHHPIRLSHVGTDINALIENLKTKINEP